MGCSGEAYSQHGAASVNRSSFQKCIARLTFYIRTSALRLIRQLPCFPIEIKGLHTDFDHWIVAYTHLLIYILHLSIRMAKL